MTPAGGFSFYGPQRTPAQSDNGNSGYVRDRNGIEVHGLSRVATKYDPKGNAIAWRYFTWEKTDDGRKQVWFGSDEQLAIARFRHRSEALPPGVLSMAVPPGSIYNPEEEDQVIYIAEDEAQEETARALNVAAERPRCKSVCSRVVNPSAPSPRRYRIHRVATVSTWIHKWLWALQDSNL